MKRFLPKSEYAKNSIISVMGVVIAAIIPIAIAPFLGRLYTPAEFNTLGLFVTTATILGVVANLRYAQAVAITNTDDEAKNLLVATIYFSFLFTLLTYVILFFTDSWIITTFDLVPADSFWLYLVPLSCFFISVCVGLNGWLNRYKRFKAMAINKSIRRGGEGIAQLSFGKLAWSGGLVFGTLLGDAINLITHLFQFKRAGGNLKNLNRGEIKKDLKTYSDFPKFNLLPSLLDTASLYLPFLIVNLGYHKDISGQFYQCTNILALPLALVSMAISQVLLQKLTEHRAEKKPVVEIIMRHIYVLTILALAGIFILSFFGEDIFVLFLGDQWGIAGQMSTILVFGYAIKFVVTPLSVIFFSHQAVRLVSYWQYLRFASIVALFLFGNTSITNFLWIYVTMDLMLYAIYLIMIVKLAKSHDKSL